MLAEATTTELTNVQNPLGLEENLTAAKQGGAVAGNARKEIEAQTGRPVITSGNTDTMLLKNAEVGMIESAAEEKWKKHTVTLFLYKRSGLLTNTISRPDFNCRYSVVLSGQTTLSRKPIYIGRVSIFPSSVFMIIY